MSDWAFSLRQTRPGGPVIALFVLFALALVVGTIGGLLAVAVAIVRAARSARRTRRSRRDASVATRAMDHHVKREHAEFQRIVNQEWPRA